MPHKDPEVRKAYKHRKYLENQEEQKAKAREYRRLNPDKVKESQRRTEIKRRDRRKVYNRKRYAEANHIIEKGKRRAWYLANREHMLILAKRYREENPEQLKEWRNSNRPKLRHIQKRREARQRQAQGRHSLEQWMAKLVYYGGQCFYCGSDQDITRDHAIPLSRGGTDWIANILPACRKCNASKHGDTYSEFLLRRSKKAA